MDGSQKGRDLTNISIYALTLHLELTNELSAVIDLLFYLV